jgi:glycerophosphoryl diester phosphodiesterase
LVGKSNLFSLADLPTEMLSNWEVLGICNELVPEPGGVVTDNFQIIAHRGSSFLAPENTLAAVQLAWQEGADAVEGDFRLTADGHIVCIHDATLKRTGGADLAVAELSLEDLERYDVGAWKHVEFTGEKVPSLDRLLRTVLPGKQFFVEIKCGAEAVTALRRAVENSVLERRQIVPICLQLPVCRAIKAALPELSVYWVVEFRRDDSVSWRPTIDDVFREMDTAGETRIDGLDVMATGPIDASFVVRARAAGLALYCWTVDDPSQARRLIELGISGITTNRPGWMRAQLRDAKP